jgi:hypothetical protein
MDELIYIKPVNNTTAVKKKKAMKRSSIIQHVMIRGQNTEVRSSTQPKMFLVEHASFKFIRAILNNDTHAFFQNRDDPINDYFYMCLEDLKKQHLEFLGVSVSDLYVLGIIYRVPHNTQGFKFKSMKTFLQCYDYKGNLNMWQDHDNKKVNIKLQVKPYDFISKTNGQRCVGLSIRVSEVHQLK